MLLNTNKQDLNCNATKKITLQKGKNVKKTVTKLQKMTYKNIEMKENYTKTLETLIIHRKQIKKHPITYKFRYFLRC